MGWPRSVSAKLTVLTSDKEIGTGGSGGESNFIVKTQIPIEGGWRYQGVPTEGGDTSVAGWQIMALKSGIMAGLDVPTTALKGAEKFLKLCSRGKGGQFCYVPEGNPSPTMTSVGLLCSQYLGMERSDPAMIEGVGTLMAHLPNPQGRNSYFWYYATQVMHNVPGPEWDSWNRKMRKLLITTQIKKGCAEGSWDPVEPGSRMPFGEAGGRLMVTSLSCLTLEVYYRYLPLYKLDEAEEAGCRRQMSPIRPHDSPFFSQSYAHHVFSLAGPAARSAAGGQRPGQRSGAAVSGKAASPRLWRDGARLSRVSPKSTQLGPGRHDEADWDLWQSKAWRLA